MAFSSAEIGELDKVINGIGAVRAHLFVGPRNQENISRCYDKLCHAEKQLKDLMYTSMLENTEQK